MGVAGSESKEATTALRLAADGMKTQGSLASSATLLGWVPESRWDSLHASEPVLPAGSFTCEVGLELETENLGLSFHCLVTSSATAEEVAVDVRRLVDGDLETGNFFFLCLVTSLATVGIWRLLPALVSCRASRPGG